MAKKKVFVSFDYDHDKQYKYLLEAWDANPDFEFGFTDLTPEEIQSSDVSRIKAAITAKINQATYTLVIVGKYANSLHPKHREIGYKNWQNFEVAKSKMNRNKLVGVKIDSTNEAPEELYGAGATWASAFKQDSILNALRQA